MPADFLNENEEKVLELDTRKKIFETARKFAGSHFREIERKTNLPSGTVKYHLSYLVKHGLLKESRDGNITRYFPKEFGTENKILLSLLRQQKVREILLFILTHKGCSHSQIVASCGVSPSTITWHIKKLEKCKVVSIRKEGRHTYYSLAVDNEEIKKLLISYQESFLDSLVDRIIEMWE